MSHVVLESNGPQSLRPVSPSGAPLGLRPIGLCPPRIRPLSLPSPALRPLAVCLLALLPADACPPGFQRGDSDASGGLEITDAVFTLSYLFLGDAPPTCMDAADSTDDGTLNIVDAIYVLNYLFLGGPEPPAPFGACGSDPTPDDLECSDYPLCQPDPWEAIVISYGNLRTLAGSGAVGDGVNGWQSSFEGGPATAADLSVPHVALGDDAGNVYIADKEAHAIRKVTPDGKIFTVAGVNEPGDDGDEPGLGSERHLNGPNGLWVKGDGTVYILDTSNAKVRRLAPDGNMTTLFAVPGLLAGRGLWVSDAEDLAYFNSLRQLKRWTPAGGVETHADGFQELGNIAVEGDGRVIVTDRGANKVYRLAPGGERTTIAGTGLTGGGGDGFAAIDTGLNGVRGVWLYPRGGYFLATHEGSQVWYVDPAGIIHLFLDGAQGAHAGDGEKFNTSGRKVSEVRAVTMDRQGNVLVTENDYGYVRIVEYFGMPPCGG